MSEVAGVVLAGGRSRRMGRDKATLSLGGSSLLAHVLAVLATAVDGPLVVVGAADTPRDLPAGLDPAVRALTTVVHDTVADRGPLPPAEALRLAHSGSPATPDQTARLTAARTAFDELTEAYEAIRRMVERGYVSLKG